LFRGESKDLPECYSEPSRAQLSESTKVWILDLDRLYLGSSFLVAESHFQDW
jgi:hypothetical protein